MRISLRICDVNIRIAFAFAGSMNRAEIAGKVHEAYTTYKLKIHDMYAYLFQGPSVMPVRGDVSQ